MIGRSLPRWREVVHRDDSLPVDLMEGMASGSLELSITTPRPLRNKFNVSVLLMPQRFTRIFPRKTVDEIEIIVSSSRRCFISDRCVLVTTLLDVFKDIRHKC